MPKNVPESEQVQREGVAPDNHWHLSGSNHELALTEIEFAIFRIFASFSRWMDDLTAYCQDEAEPPCSGLDFSLLNVIRMNDRPKGISEIGRLLNRDDISNMQYSMRKLVKFDFIEKVGAKGNKKGATYRATEKGIEATNRYAKFRRELLLPLTQSLSESDQRMAQVTNMLTLMSGIYDQAACVAATHRDMVPPANTT
ncbi:MAG: winged helix DNA-binding protein [Halioglobus sp.]